MIKFFSPVEKPSYTTDTVSSVFLNVFSALEKTGFYVSELSQKFHTIASDDAQILNKFSTSFTQKRNQQLQRNNPELLREIDYTNFKDK